MRLSFEPFLSVLSLEEIMTTEISNSAHVEQTMTGCYHLSQLFISCQLHGKLVVVNIRTSHANTNTD